MKVQTDATGMIQRDVIPGTDPSAARERAREMAVTGMEI